MREIKFRAWNKPTKQMIYWGFFTDIFDKGAGDRRNFEPEHNEFMQYTGIKDKNGKEIYENDIVSFIWFDEYSTNSPLEVSGEVLFQAGMFEVVWGDKSHIQLCRLCDAEVIGNIYQNSPYDFNK